MIARVSHAGGRIKAINSSNPMGSRPVVLMPSPSFASGKASGGAHDKFLEVGAMEIGGAFHPRSTPDYTLRWLGEAHRPRRVRGVAGASRVLSASATVSAKDRPW